MMVSGKRVRQLVIDTATEAFSVALLDDGHCLQQQYELIGRGHAERLLPAIAELPDGGRADEIVVDVGPGSFTGLRVGIAAARALAFAWDVPVRGYHSLSMVAHLASPLHLQDEPVFVAMNGGHGELFWQLFDNVALKAISGISSSPIAQLAGMSDIANIAHIYGSGAQALLTARGHGVAHTLYPVASSFNDLPAAFHMSDAAAMYGRGADARPLSDQARPPSDKDSGNAP